MVDQQQWEQAVSDIITGYHTMDTAGRQKIDAQLGTIIRLKQELMAQVQAAGGAEICRTCGGECCLHGKYHVSGLDVLAFRATATALVAPNFGNAPYCPYSDTTGCLMAPCHRPMTCVIFNCDRIEERLTPASRDAVHACEQKLRDAITRAGRIGTMQLSRPALLLAEQSTRV